MIEMMGTLIRYIVILIFCFALLEMILPQGVFRRYLRVIVGIMLIFTILSPIQNFMKITPYWELPGAWAGEMGEKDIGEILKTGEVVQDNNVNLALKEYRNNLHEVIHKRIKRDYDLEVVELEMEIDEDPNSIYFGVINQLTILLEHADSVESNEEETVKVPEVIIGVFRKKDEPEEVIDEEVIDEEESLKFKEIEEDITEHLAAFLGLSSRDIIVKLRGSGKSNG